MDDRLQLLDGEGGRLTLGRPSHVGLVVNDWPEAGTPPTGTGRNARDLGQLLVGAGFKVSALALPQDRTWTARPRSLDDRGTRVVVAPVPLTSLRAWYRNLQGVRIADRWLAETRPDVVHIVHFGFAGIDFAGRVVAAGTPVVSVAADALLACAMGHLVNPLIRRPVCRLPVDAATCAACMATGTTYDPALMQSLQTERRALAAAAVAAGPVLADSRYTMEELSRAFPGDHRHVPWPVMDAPASSPSTRDGKLLVGFFGPPTWRKGLDVLLAAAAGVPDIELHAFGPNNDRERSHVDIEEAARSGALVWHGPYAPENAMSLMRSVDVVALPSRSESLPGVVKEALAAGTPVLASRVAGVPEVVIEDVSGWLVPSEDVGAWRTALKRLAASPELARRLRPSAVGSAPGLYLKAVLDVYEEVLAEPVDAAPARDRLDDARRIREEHANLAGDELFQASLIDLRGGRRLRAAAGLARSWSRTRIPRAASTVRLALSAPLGYERATARSRDANA